MKKTKALSILRLVAVAVTLVFEILPCGAVCVFATPEERMVRYYSYFSLVPYGYANFAPLITAILTCVLLILTVISFFRAGDRVKKSVLWVSVLAAVISLCPLLLGIRFFSVVGAIISALLFSAVALSILCRRCDNA